MKITVTVKSCDPSSDGGKVLVGVDEYRGQIEIDNKGMIRENRPAIGSKIEVTISADNAKKLEQGVSVAGRYHGVIVQRGKAAPAESGAAARSSDFGGDKG